MPPNRPSNRLHQVFLLIVALILITPIAAVMGSWFQWSDETAQILREMSNTVLPRYIQTTVWLAVVVGLGTAIVGASTAAVVTLFDFQGRRSLEWILLLPLAMPAYVVAYAYTDFLQFSGPMQTWIRHTFGLQGRVLPEIRNASGAAWVFIFSLYPYVYLLTRTALGERASHLMEAARMLGAPLGRRVWQIAIPLARPAIMAGVALAMMETLADFGVSSYFGIQTFTTGIYKAWLSMDNRIAAAQLATLLLIVVVFVLKLETSAQRKMRFASGRGARAGSNEARPIQLRGIRASMAWIFCLLPVLMGFVFPVLFMLRPLSADWSVLPWDRFVQWASNSVRLGAITAVIAVGVAAMLAFSMRRWPDRLTRGVVQLAGLGYAIPGAVIVVGLLLPIGWLQQAAPALNAGYFITATIAGLVWAYLVRFSSVALQSVQSGYSRIPTSFDDSARMLGTGPMALMTRVHWPLLARSLSAAGLLVFVDVMKELPATMVLRPFNSDTLAVTAYQLARDERLGEAALPSLALVLVGLIPVIWLSRTLRADGAKPSSAKRAVDTPLKTTL